MPNYTSEILVRISITDSDSGGPFTRRAALYGGMYPASPGSSFIVHWEGRVKSDVSFSKRIGVDLWKEESAVDFGYLDIAVNDQSAEWVALGQSALVGGVTFYRVDEAGALSILAEARTSDIGWADEDTIRLRLESPLAGGFDAPINDKYFDSTYPHLEGKPYPIVRGISTDPQQVLPALEVDGTTLEYDLADEDILSLTTVYDRGVSVSFTATTYGFTLSANPDGRITAGSVAMLDPVVVGLLVGLFKIVRLAATTTGIWGNVDEAELTQLMSDTELNGNYHPFFATDKVLSFSDFLKIVLKNEIGRAHV